MAVSWARMPLFALLPTASWSADLRIGPGQPYAELQTAVKDALDGDRLLIFPGAYGPAAVHASIEIVGVGGASQTVVQAQGGPALAVDSGASVRLRGLTLDGDGVDRAAWVQGAQLEVDDS